MELKVPGSRLGLANFFAILLFSSKWSKISPIFFLQSYFEPFSELERVGDPYRVKVHFSADAGALVAPTQSGATLRTIHLLLLNSLLYNNLSGGSNPVLSNKVSWP